MKTTIHTIISGGKVFIEIHDAKGRIIASHQMSQKDIKTVLKVAANQMK